MEAFVTSEIKNGIGTITFFHPQSNSMPGSQLRNLANEVEKLGKVENVKVIVCVLVLSTIAFSASKLVAYELAELRNATAVKPVPER